MQIPTGTSDSIQATASEVLAACAGPVSGTEPDLPDLEKAFSQLADVLRRVEADAGTSRATDAAGITEIGEYALRLQASLATTAGRLDLPEQQASLARLAIDMALWIARLGGQIDTLEPVVDAVALAANSTREPQQLAELSEIIVQLIGAVPAVIREDLEKVNPGRPWRILLLNHCIVATRSLDTGLMEAAFADLTRHLPEDAPRFFTEGMQQMDALDYPAHVRRVMEKYHRQWTLKRSLH